MTMTIPLTKPGNQRALFFACMLSIGVFMVTPAGFADGNAVRMEEAEAWVREEAESLNAKDFQGTHPWPEGFAWALASLEYSMSRLSSFRYHGFINNGVLPGFDHKRSLENGVGACGNYVQLACDLIRKSPTPLPCRSVQFFIHAEKSSGNNSHVAIEVFYGGSWRLFDPYFGISPGAPGAFHPSKILPASEAIEMSQQGKEFSRLDIGRCAMRLVYEGLGKAVFSYLKATPKDVLYGATGVINLAASADGTELSLQNMPTYVGQSADYNGEIGDLKFVYNNAPAPVRSLICTVAGVGGLIHECDLKITVSGKEVFLLTLDKIDLNAPILIPLPTPKDKVLFEVVSSQGKQGYVVWKRIGINPKLPEH